MVFTKFSEAASRVAADARAADRLAAPIAPQALTTPTLETWLLVPAQAAPKSSAEVFAESEDVRLHATQSLEAVRGRKVVQTGDAVKGTRQEVHLDPVLVRAPGGKVILDAPTGHLDHVHPEAAHGVAVAPGILQQDTPLAHVSWDHTEELRRQQAEMMMRTGGMPGWAGAGMMGMLPETAGFSLSFYRSGTSMSGFAPGASRPGVSGNPVLDAARARVAPGMARGEARWAEFESMAGPVGGPDMRARVLGHVVPNGIVERMQHHRDAMIQFHEREQYEREQEDFLNCYEYAVDLDERSADAAVSPPDSELKRIIQDNPELKKALATQRSAKEKLRAAAQLEAQGLALNREALVGHLGVQLPQQAAAASLRQQAYAMLASANDSLNAFARTHPDLTHYTVKLMEWGGAALHAGAYVVAGVSGGPVGIAALIAVEQAIGASLEAAIELGADHAAASGRTADEAARLREAFIEMTGKGLIVASFVGISKGVRAAGGAARPGALKIKFDYTSEGAAYSLRVDPTGKGPMHIDARNFTKADSYTALGAPRNKNQFWQLWKEKYPETMSAENLALITKSKPLAPRVDQTWIQHFPEHAEYLGEILVHHHIDHGNLVNALPKSLHGEAPGRSMFHDILGGKK